MKKEHYIFIGLGAIACGVSIYFGYKKYKEYKEFKKENDEIKEELDKDLEDAHETLYEEKRDEIKEKLLKNWNKPPIGGAARDTGDEEDPISYTKSEEDVIREFAENEHPMDSDEDEDYENDALNDPDEMEVLKKDLEDESFYQANKNKPPKIISSSAVDSIPASFEPIEWIYFAKDDVITDENEIVVDDFERFVGDCLDKYEFRDDNNQEEIWVLSYEFRSLYHVTKYFLSYEEKMKASEEYLKDVTTEYA